MIDFPIVSSDNPQDTIDVPIAPSDNTQDAIDVPIVPIDNLLDVIKVPVVSSDNRCDAIEVSINLVSERNGVLLRQSEDSIVDDLSDAPQIIKVKVEQTLPIYRKRLIRFLLHFFEMTWDDEVAQLLLVY